MHLCDDKVYGLDFKKAGFKELTQIIAIGNLVNLGKPLVLTVFIFFIQMKSLITCGLKNYLSVN